MFRVSRFSELLKHLPRGLFDRVVEKSKADRYCKSFSSWQQLVVMVYAQLSNAPSLRVLVASFNAHAAHHFHLGCKALRRSTLADMNRRGSPEAFMQVAQTLMQCMRGTLRREGNELLQLLDSTSITLKGLGFDTWTQHQRTRNTQGIKLHVLLAHARQIPLAHEFTAANVIDLAYARTLPIQKGATYVFDRAYCDFNWWWKLNCEHAKFVTRFKSNTRLTLIDSRPIARAAREVIRSDEIVRLANKNPGAGRHNPYAAPLRRILVIRPGKRDLVLATNDMRSSAVRIAQTYKARWQIELFFKWIKQHLKIKQFLGRSRAAVYVQILCALIAYLLIALHAKQQALTESFWLILSEIRASLFQRPDTDRERHRRWREQLSRFEDLQQSLL